MGRVVSFEDHAVARLRDRLGAAENARADLLAFARGHSEAVASIHRAVLRTLESADLDGVFESVVKEWPALLGVDSIVLTLIVGHQGFRVDRDGITHLAPAIVDRAAAPLEGAVMRGVSRGHALFGREGREMRAEALVPFGGVGPFPRGLLLLGHRSDADSGASHGAELLEFLGDFLAAMMRRWLSEPTTMANIRLAP